MAARRLATYVAFGIGILLDLAAAILFLVARTAPAEGMEDLARVVGAMFLAAIAIVPFGIALALGRREMPRWMRITTIALLLLGLVPAIWLVLVRLGA